MGMYWAILIGSPLFSTILLFYIAHALKTRVFVYTGLIAVFILIQLYYYNVINARLTLPEYMRIHLVFLCAVLLVTLLIHYDQSLLKGRDIVHFSPIWREFIFGTALASSIVATTLSWIVPLEIFKSLIALRLIVLSTFMIINLLMALIPIQEMITSIDPLNWSFVNGGFLMLCISGGFGIGMHAYDMSPVYMQIHLLCIACAPLLFASHAILCLNRVKKGNYVTMLQTFALIDSLTKVYNRRAFTEHCNLLQERSKHEDLWFALLYIDIDQFKHINDSYDHTVGDQILYSFAQRISNLLRSEDRLYRIGGDEFIVYVSISNRPMQKVLDLIIQRIIRTCTRPYIVHNLSLYVRCSIGVAVYPFDNIPIKKMSNYSDVAMLSAKRSPTTSVTYYREL